MNVGGERDARAERAKANDVLRRSYAREAPGYDRASDRFERWLLGTEHRGWACSRAEGDTLEVAVGTALNLPHYPSGVRLTGVDLSPDMLARAADRARRLGRRIELLEADAHDLPFADESFDTVVCTYALCAVPDLVRALSEMRRVLKPGGRLVLVDHVRSTLPPLYWVQWLGDHIPPLAQGESMTRRPSLQVSALGFDVVERDRMRAGVVERLVAVKIPA
jgi:ubiquinone/menaquinone biosynthesis C-methylase UbiE